MSGATSAPVAIGDIHGRLDLLELTVAAFPDRPLVFLGDLTDRGPDSRGVIALVRTLVEAGRAELCLGNHDDMLVNAVLGGAPHVLQHWTENGGDVTVQGYGENPSILVTDARWLRDTALPSLIRGHVLFAHAMRPDPSGHDVDAHLWGRPGDTPLYALPSGVSHSVHGHTPTERPISLGAPDGTVAWFIDTGAFHTGTLCALDTQDWTPHLLRVAG